MKIIFLDVDGELTYSDYENPDTANIDVEKVKLLKQVCDRTGAKVVISSSWRGTPNGKPHIYHVLTRILAENGIEVLGDLPYIDSVFERHTPDAGMSLFDESLYKLKMIHGTGRAAEVEAWLKEHDDVESFVILDDEDWDWSDYGYEKNWIRPTWHGDGGLKPEHVEQAILILKENAMNSSQEQADRITIGRFLARLTHHDYYYSRYWEELMASSFLEYAGIRDEDKIHRLMKSLTTGFSYDVQLMLLQYLVTGNTDRSFVTDYVRVAKDDAFCSVCVCRNMDKADTSALSPVISKYAHNKKDFIVINDLESVRKGVGASLMHELLQKLNRPCLIDVKLLHDGEIELSESCAEISERVAKLITYFKPLGFRDITDLYDSEDLCIMLYDNFDEPKKIYL